MTAGPAPVPAAGRRRAPRVLAVLLTALVLLFSALTIVQSASAHKISVGSFNTGAGLMLTLWVIAAVGLVVAWHQPANPIGWLLLAVPVLVPPRRARNAAAHEAIRRAKEWGTKLEEARDQPLIRGAITAERAAELIADIQASRDAR